MCKGFSQALSFWETGSPYSTRSQSLLNLLLLDSAFPSTRQGMYPLVALERSTLRRMSLNQHSSCCRVFPEALGISRLFRCNRTRCGGGTCHCGRRYIHRCRLRLGHNSLYFFLILYPLLQCGTAYQAEILGAASGAELPDIEQMKKIVPLIARELPFSQNVCELMFGVNVTDLDLGAQIYPVQQPMQSNSVGS